MSIPLRLRCPDCHAPLDPSALTCARGHAFGYDENDVLVLLAADFAPRLDRFLAGFQPLRASEDRRLLDPAIYPQLPVASAVRQNHEWRLRAYDLDIIARLLAGRTGLRILDIGAWNGWLSHRLVGMGHQVIAIDYFVDEHDGLGARKWYDSDWAAIQMNLDDLSILADRFDAIILNRCLQFFVDPPAYAQTARQLLTPGGLLILTGLEFLRDPTSRQASVIALRQRLNQHGIDFFKPIKGYLDASDRARLASMGIELRPYPQLRLANLKACFVAQAPQHLYGLVSSPS